MTQWESEDSSVGSKSYAETHSSPIPLGSYLTESPPLGPRTREHCPKVTPSILTKPPLASHPHPHTHTPLVLALAPLTSRRFPPVHSARSCISYPSLPFAIQNSSPGKIVSWSQEDSSISLPSPLAPFLGPLPSLPPLQSQNLSSRTHGKLKPRGRKGTQSWTPPTPALTLVRSQECSPTPHSGSEKTKPCRLPPAPDQDPCPRGWDYVQPLSTFQPFHISSDQLLPRLFFPGLRHT